MICCKNRKNKLFYDNRNWQMKDFDSQKWKKIGKQLSRNNRKMKKINIDVMFKLKCN